mmetsp:Transcript_80602/g.260538  ORF Transcript_80602/g.260538 Transcript_80602/m.260538 type:complete len:297 (-) Transcript_80602:443-1333(-)
MHALRALCHPLPHHPLDRGPSHCRRHVHDVAPGRAVLETLAKWHLRSGLRCPQPLPDGEHPTLRGHHHTHCPGKHAVGLEGGERRIVRVQASVHGVQQLHALFDDESLGPCHRFRDLPRHVCRLPCLSASSRKSVRHEACACIERVLLGHVLLLRQHCSSLFRGDELCPEPQREVDAAGRPKRDLFRGRLDADARRGDLVDSVLVPWFRRPLLACDLRCAAVLGQFGLSDALEVLVHQVPHRPRLVLDDHRRERCHDQHRLHLPQRPPDADLLDFDVVGLVLGAGRHLQALAADGH